MVTGRVSAEGSLWVAFSGCAHVVFPGWLCRGGKQGGWRGAERERERSLGVSSSLFFLSSSHPDFMITEILQVSTVGEYHYNKYR